MEPRRRAIAAGRGRPPRRGWRPPRASLSSVAAGTDQSGNIRGACRAPGRASGASRRGRHSAPWCIPGPLHRQPPWRRAQPVPSTSRNAARGPRASVFPSRGREIGRRSRGVRPSTRVSRPSLMVERTARTYWGHRTRVRAPAKKVAAPKGPTAPARASEANRGRRGLRSGPRDGDTPTRKTCPSAPRFVSHRQGQRNRRCSMTFRRALSAPPRATAGLDQTRSEVASAVARGPPHADREARPAQVVEAFSHPRASTYPNGRGSLPFLRRGRWSTAKSRSACWWCRRSGGGNSPGRERSFESIATS